jgi:hypothetical protein
MIRGRTTSAVHRVSPMTVVGGQQLRRHTRHTNTFPDRPAGADISWRNDMSSMIEDLARDRIRQIQRDTELARQVTRARAALRAARGTSQG